MLHTVALKTITRHLARFVLTLLAGGLIGATLVRMAPAFGIDEQELDSHLNRETIESIRRDNAPDRNILRFYGHYLSGIAHGDLGQSMSFKRPVAELIRERLPVTLSYLVTGVGAGLLLGFTLALLGTRFRFLVFDLVPTFASGLCLSIPSAVLALVFLLLGKPGQWALALVVFPYIYRYSRNLLMQIQDAPHVIAARARGVRPAHLVARHILPIAGPQLLALIGIAIAIAFPACVPIEVMSEAPGIGQLAWNAASSRDLPVLVNLTLLATAIVLAGNSLSDVLIRAVRSESQ